MGGLTAADMAELAALDQVFMPDLADIVTPGTPTRDDDNSPIPGTPTYQTAVPCRMVAGPQAAELLAAMRLTNVADRIIYLPLSQALTTKQQIRFPTGGGGKVYEIVGVETESSYGTSTSAALKLVT
jgi:hypothetical protein